VDGIAKGLDERRGSRKIRHVDRDDEPFANRNRRGRVFCDG
jgi:hypothetical protein